MNVFPQLSSGSGAQYPLVWRRQTRSAANYLRDGSVLNYADFALAAKRWELAATDLTDAESGAIQSLFERMEGRRGTFTFVDPAANLLAHSEDFANEVWSKGPLVQVTGGVDDPRGGRRAARLINASQIAQAVSQTLAAPAWFVYSLSVYARSAGETAITLTRSTASNSHSRRYAAGPGWTRCALSGALTASDAEVRLSMEIAAATAVDVYGMQLEAQPCPSAYKRTGERNGVYSNARFDDDVLRSISDGPDQHRLNLRIAAKD